MKRLVAIIALALPLAACAVSQQEEVAMGEQYSAQINQQLPIMSDPELNRYINVLGDSLARLTSRADLEDGGSTFACRRLWRRYRNHCTV